MQTTGTMIDNGYLRFLRNHVGVSTISLSLASLDNDANAAITHMAKPVDIQLLCFDVKRYDFNLRLSINLTKEIEENWPDVEKLRGLELWIDRDHATPLPEGMFYLADLMGCEAVDEAGKTLGKLTEILQHGPTDVYVFRAPNGKTWMAPALPDAFPEKDVERGVIRVNSERLKEVAVDAD